MNYDDETLGELFMRLRNAQQEPTGPAGETMGPAPTPTPIPKPTPDPAAMTPAPQARPSVSGAAFRDTPSPDELSSPGNTIRSGFDPRLKQKFQAPNRPRMPDAASYGTGDVMRSTSTETPTDEPPLSEDLGVFGSTAGWVGAGLPVYLPDRPARSRKERPDNISPVEQVRHRDEMTPAMKAVINQRFSRPRQGLAGDYQPTPFESRGKQEFKRNMPPSQPTPPEGQQTFEKGRIHSGFSLSGPPKQTPAPTRGGATQAGPPNTNFKVPGAPAPVQPTQTNRPAPAAPTAQVRSRANQRVVDWENKTYGRAVTEEGGFGGELTEPAGAPAEGDFGDRAPQQGRRPSVVAAGYESSGDQEPQQPTTSGKPSQVEAAKAETDTSYDGAASGGSTPAVLPNVRYDKSIPLGKPELRGPARPGVNLPESDTTAYGRAEVFDKANKGLPLGPPDSSSPIRPSRPLYSPAPGEPTEKDLYMSVHPESMHKGVKNRIKHGFEMLAYQNIGAPADPNMKYAGGRMLGNLLSGILYPQAADDAYKERVSKPRQAKEKAEAEAEYQQTHEHTQIEDAEVSRKYDIEKKKQEAAAAGKEIINRRSPDGKFDVTYIVDRAAGTSTEIAREPHVEGLMDVPPGGKVIGKETAKEYAQGNPKPPAAKKVHTPSSARTAAEAEIKSKYNIPALIDSYLAGRPNAEQQEHNAITNNARYDIYAPVDKNAPPPKPGEKPKTIGQEDSFAHDKRITEDPSADEKEKKDAQARMKQAKEAARKRVEKEVMGNLEQEINTRANQLTGQSYVDSEDQQAQPGAAAAPTGTPQVAPAPQKGGGPMQFEQWAAERKRLRMMGMSEDQIKQDMEQRGLQ